MLTKTELPAIVIVAFNRPKSLSRILQSIAVADYEGYTNIPLVISIDKSDCAQVAEIANAFNWEYGFKYVIQHETNMGLRKHIIACGDLTEKYGAVIVLEDDLVVSASFYDYAVQAMHFYSSATNISGISLYAYDFNEYAKMRFCEINDGYDNYFIQTASSWGQLWTQKQWNGFKKWYQANAQIPITQNDPLPDEVIKWKESSWKKYFIKYMVLEQKYFVYPRVSLSTNFGDAGTNHRGKNSNYQVSILLRRKNYSFSQFENSNCIYDSHYEIEPQCLKYFNPVLRDLNFECDFYGTKDLNKVKADCLISIRECINPIATYASHFMPQELNVVFNLEGNFFKLAKVSSFSNIKRENQVAQLRHLHKNLGWKRYLTLLSQVVWEGIRRKVNYKNN